MDIQQVTYNPSTMCGVKTNEYTIQGKNAEEVIQIMKGMQSSTASQVIGGVCILATTAVACWVGVRAMKLLSFQVKAEYEERKKDE